ncbi:unnamed protein product [Sphagnum troendelagicum]|uniref:Uncharacterized protein n=1 Tax=Sphagnum troendelagicum TaxID=128251 RepID=A0ABP0T8V9_9BRYO
MSGLPRIEEDDGRDSRQLDMMTVGDTGESMAEYAPTHLGARREAADLTISESRMSRIKEDDARDSGQEDMRTASVAGNSRVDVPAKTSDGWIAPMVKMDAVRRFRSSLARFCSRKAKPEENFMRDDTSMYSDDNETFRSDDLVTVSVDGETVDRILSILQERSLPESNPTFPVGSKHAPHSQFSGAVMHEKENDQDQETSGLESPSYSRIGLPGSQCETDDHLKQESNLSTIGIGDTPENFFQTGIPKMENNSILTMGRKGKFEGADSIEFLFKGAEDMSKVVGVGLQWSKVLVTKQFGVVVKHIGEHLWSDLWKETSFSPMRIPIPKPPTNHELSMCNLTPKESSKRFGVGLMGSRLESRCIYVEDDKKQTGEMFPFIFELAEKMGLSENVKDSNFQHPSGISSEAMEEEKNDHGGPLLEILEGAETNQGDISIEPMDPMDVGESSQGGNSGEPMEGVESGQGGPSRTPTEVGGQRDQQSSDFQLRFESLQAKGPQDSNENKSLTVIIIPEVGGTFYEGLSNRQVQPDCRIKGAAIAPWLKFKFEILGGERKITTTTETACDLGGGQLRLHEDWNLGYCHDNITIFLTCADPQAVQVSPGTVVAMDVMKRIMTETTTGSTSRANQVSGQASVQVQIPVVPIGVQAQGTLDVTDTIVDSCALAVTIESSNTQFAGFDVNEVGCASSLVFSFVYPEEIVDVMPRGQKQFMRAGISKTLWPSIIGKWIPLDREDACLYTFKTERHIYSIRSLRRSHAARKEPILFMQQRYEVPFFINHAMSHIHYYENTELRGPGVQSLPKVVTKYPEI